MSEVFAVKSGVVLPERENKGGVQPRYPFKTLPVGGMFFVPEKTTQYMSTYAASQGRKLGKKFNTQTTCMRQDLQTRQWEPCAQGAPGAREGVAITRVS